MPEPITYKAMLDILNSGKPFDIEYVKADVERGTAGQLRAFRKVSLARDMPRRTRAKTAAQATRKSVSPRHETHETINIFVPGEPDRSRRIKKVHTRLITLINGQEIL